jgi:hypothetical protein
VQAQQSTRSNCSRRSTRRFRRRAESFRSGIGGALLCCTTVHRMTGLVYARRFPVSTSATHTFRKMSGTCDQRDDSYALAHQATHDVCVRQCTARQVVHCFLRLEVFENTKMCAKFRALAGNARIGLLLQSVQLPFRDRKSACARCSKGHIRARISRPSLDLHFSPSSRMVQKRRQCAIDVSTIFCRTRVL